MKFPTDLKSCSKIQLQELHATLEKRIEELNSNRTLTPEESHEVLILKKRKLAIKDQLQQLD